MIKILRLKWTDLDFLLAVFLFIFMGQTALALAWVEPSASPIYDPVATAEKAYFPSILKMGDNDYRMWYQSNSTPGNATIAYALSTDGLSWTMATSTVSGLIPDNAGHPHVEFSDSKFRIWYWNVATPYGNNAMHYAESVDGLTWTNDTAITGDLITSIGGLWNSGSYGVVDVIINDSPTNTSTNPFDYKYAMYYDVTSGGYEQIALGYSIDGIDWTLSGDGPVLPKGPAGSWDSVYATVGTVLKEDIWKMWYSGGVSASNEGIGYATSTDGLVWTKSATNPFMSKSDGVAWRDNRTYTPSIINDSSDYKMWFTGKDSATGNYAIGYATLEIPPILPIPATLHVISLVVNSSSSNAAASDFMVSLKTANEDVSGSPLAGVASPGTDYSLPAGTYVVSVNASTSYDRSFNGDCDSDGLIVLSAGQDKTCTVINTNVPPPPPLVTPVVTPVVSGRSHNGGNGSLVIPRVVPLIGVLKTPDPLALPAGPGLINYIYLVWNVGGKQALVDVTITDDKCSLVTLVSGDLNNNKKLDPGENWIYNCSTSLSQTTTNTAVVTGYSDDIYHQPAIATAVSTVVVGVPLLPETGIVPPLVNIVVVPSRLTPFPFGGGKVKYTYTVTNPGVTAMGNVSVTSNTCEAISRPTGDINQNNLIDLNESWVYTCLANISNSTRSIATVKGQANGLTALGYAFADVLVSAPGVEQQPVLTVDFPDIRPAIIDLGQRIKTVLRDLTEGNNNSEIIILQQFLISQDRGPAAKALARIGATAYFGPLTRSALAEWQKKAGINPALGNFGPVTRAYLIENY